MIINKGKLEDLRMLNEKLASVLGWHPSHAQQSFIVASTVAEMAEMVGYKRGWIEPGSVIDSIMANARQQGESAGD